MIKQESKIEIESLVQEILNEKHSSYEKQKIDRDESYLRFACPRCGDSEKNDRKKRGNLFYDSGFYHCYNCHWHTNILKFFSLFGKQIDDVNIRINVRKTVNDFIEAGIANKVTSINTEMIEGLKSYAIPKADIMNKLYIKPISMDHEYVKKKHLKHMVHRMGAKNGNVYFFNMIDDENVIGFQIRTFNPKFENSSKYIKYPLSKIYAKFFPDKKVESAEKLKSLDKVSLLYNLFNVNFNYNVTIFEGCSDSWLYPNSIGKSSVGVEMDSLDDAKNTRYFFDNDEAGYEKQAEKMKKGKKVFLWQKFINDFNLWEYNEKGEIKDWADIIHLSTVLKKPFFREAEKYFSNDELDLIYV